jgi:hypothetical protein
MKKCAVVAIVVLLGMGANLWAQNSTMWYDTNMYTRSDGGDATSWRQDSGSGTGFYGSSSKTCLIESNGRWAAIACPTDCPADSRGNGGTQWYDSRQSMSNGGMGWKQTSADTFSSPSKTCLIQRDGNWASVACPTDCPTDCPTSKGNGGQACSTLWYDTNNDARGKSATDWKQDGGMSSYGTPSKTCLIQRGGSWATIACPD